MSARYRRHYADPRGAIIEDAKGEALFCARASAPTDGDQGYQPGCLFVNTAGAAGSFLYVNQGSFTSANWLNIA